MLTFTLQACVNTAWIIAPQQSVERSKMVLRSTAELNPSPTGHFEMMPHETMPL